MNLGTKRNRYTSWNATRLAYRIQYPENCFLIRICRLVAFGDSVAIRLTSDELPQTDRCGGEAGSRWRCGQTGGRLASANDELSSG